jgi:hypothetical protein
LLEPSYQQLKERCLLESGRLFNSSQYPDNDDSFAVIARWLIAKTYRLKGEPDVALAGQLAILANKMRPARKVPTLMKNSAIVF